jgi:hypothetical protein
MKKKLKKKKSKFKQTKSNQTKSNQTKSNQTKSNQAKSDPMNRPARTSSCDFMAFMSTLGFSGSLTCLKASAVMLVAMTTVSRAIGSSMPSFRANSAALGDGKRTLEMMMGINI